jgi:hypothetical protein
VFQKLTGSDPDWLAGMWFVCVKSQKRPQVGRLPEYWVPPAAGSWGLPKKTEPVETLPMFMLPDWPPVTGPNGIDAGLLKKLWDEPEDCWGAVTGTGCPTGRLLKNEPDACGEMPFDPPLTGTALCVHVGLPATGTKFPDPSRIAMGRQK